MQCCGSGIRDLVPFWHLDPGSGIGVFLIPDLRSPLSFVAVSGSRIRDPGWVKMSLRCGSGSVLLVIYKLMGIPGIRLRIIYHFIGSEGLFDVDAELDADPR
jgi:hypothetical protein